MSCARTVHKNLLSELISRLPLGVPLTDVVSGDTYSRSRENDTALIGTGGEVLDLEPVESVLVAKTAEGGFVITRNLTVILVRPADLRSEPLSGEPCAFSMPAREAKATAACEAFFRGCELRLEGRGKHWNHTDDSASIIVSVSGVRGLPRGMRSAKTFTANFVPGTETVKTVALT